MIVTLSTTQSNAQPCSRGVPDPLCDVFRQVFPVLNAPFSTHHPETIVPGSDLLFSRGVLQQVSRELLDSELIKGLVGVQGFNHILPKR